MSFETSRLETSHPSVVFLTDIDTGLESKLNPHQLGKAYYNLAKLYYDKSDLDQAYDFFIKSYDLAQRPKDNFAVLKILGFLIRISSEKLDDLKAKNFIDQAQIVINELGSSLGSLNAEYFYNLGIISNYKGNFLDAKTNFDLAYKRCKDENEPELLSKCLLSLATSEYKLKNYKEALAYLAQLKNLLGILNKQYMLGALYYFSAKVYEELEQFQEALQSYDQANSFLQSKKCWNLYGYILLGKGIIYKKLGNFDKASTFFSMSKNINDLHTFRRLNNLIDAEIADVHDSNVDIYLDKNSRKVVEKTIGTIDFKHRFVLLEILFLLAKNCGKYFDKEKLAKYIWKDEYNPLIHDKLIYTSVSRLRKLIEPKGDKTSSRRKYIIRGKDGYTFNPDVQIRFHLGAKSESFTSIGHIDLSSPV